jgi:hypothetical protein
MHGLPALLVTQLEALNLASGGLWQVVDKLNPTRVFIWGNSIFDKLL